MEAIDLSGKKKIDQLYHPTGRFGQDRFGLVYSQGNLNTTKFIPILLKEWFYLVKKGGYLVIDYIPNNLCDFDKLERVMWWLWKGKYEIVTHGSVDADSRYSRFVCKKLVSTIFRNDAIDKWTFGIITNGKREEWMKKIISSIRKQKVKNYQIIICGIYRGQRSKDILYIPFSDRDDRGWITKKKNLIVRKAKYENICLIHDRMILNEDWYKGMRKWGNCFENLGCRQFYRGERVNDWIASHFFIYKNNKLYYSLGSYVDYKDWYDSVWFLGQLNIFKKSILLENDLFWDEGLYYGESEDYDLSTRFSREGFIHRFNDLSSVSTLTNKYINPSFILFDPVSEKPRMDFQDLNSFFKVLTYCIVKILVFCHVAPSKLIIETLRSKVYTSFLKVTRERKNHLEEWERTIKAQ